MEHLREALDRALKKTGADGLINKGRAIALWPSIVGDEISQATEATKMDNGILYVKTKSPVWRNELMFQKREIVKKINKHLKQHIVKDLRLI